MAKRTKHLLELSDVKAVVLTCSQCGCDLGLTVTREARVPYACPGCGRDWDPTHSQTGFNALIGDYVRRHRSLQDALGSPLTENLGYRMSLEVDIDEPKAVDIPALPGR